MKNLKKSDLILHICHRANNDYIAYGHTKRAVYWALFKSLRNAQADKDSARTLSWLIKIYITSITFLYQLRYSATQISELLESGGRLPYNITYEQHLDNMCNHTVLKLLVSFANTAFLEISEMVGNSSSATWKIFKNLGAP